MDYGGILYAITDEVHQLYIPGRSGKWQDVCIDSIGVLLGIFVLLLIVEIIYKIKQKKIQT